MNWPKHVAIIPDWNRTWAKENNYPKMVWHVRWFQQAVNITNYVFLSTPIRVLTLWWLSTENLKWRSKEELDYLFDIFMQVPKQLKQLFEKEKIKFKAVWNLSWLPKRLQKFLEEQKKKTEKHKTDRYFVMCLNYWWQDEIIRWINKFLKENDKKSLTVEEFGKYLDFGQLPVVDLVIRTKWNMAKRLSGFMLWWIWYAQLYFTDLKFPDFNIEEFKNALNWYDKVIKYQNKGK